jgi:hypothetical protein
MAKRKAMSQIAKMLGAKKRAPTFYSSVVFTLDSHLSLSRSLGVRHSTFVETL